AHARKSRAGGEIDSILERRGLIARMFFFLYRRIDASWKMYPVGFLFGLGFDTATEIALLAIAAEAAVSGRFPIAAIMLFPVLFTAGMTLVDTLDGALMMRIYEWASSDALKKLFFNTLITGLTVAVALSIAAIEWLQAVSVGFKLDGGVWRALNAANSSEVGMLTVVLIGLVWLVGWRRYRRLFATTAERSRSAP
ncbi:MAG: HoxN/HupN/NixA family nickel/cobalt transporter, partial [Candidatus Binataceae bacterium]